jgi:hypothetical protein
MVTLTFASGTDAATVAAAVSPASALDAIWRLDNSSGSFQAFRPQAPQASDLQSVNPLDAVFLCLNATADIAMPTLSPDPSTTISTPLGAGCNVVGLSFPDGTDPSQVADAVTPADAFESMWRLDNASGSFEAYMAAAPEASDLTSLQFLDAVFLCTAGAGDLDMPGVAEATTPGVVGPSGDIRFVMEAAVPQVVDLPPQFEAIHESFESYEPPGLLYYYWILYGDPRGYDAPLKAPAYFTFDLALFDTVGNATSAMEEFTSASPEELKADLQPRYGGSLGLEIGTVTLQLLDPPAMLGDDAAWHRFTLMLRPAHSNELFLPFVTDVITIRRDRVLGRVWLDWSWGPPGRNAIPENLAKIMDAGIQEALPELLAAAP